MDSHRIFLLLFIVFDVILTVYSQNVLLDEVNGFLRRNIRLIRSFHLMLTEESRDSPTLLPRNDAQMNIRQRIMGRRQTRGPILAKKEICYDMIGCFDLPRKHSFKKPPQSPDFIDTKFWLYTRSTAKLLNYSEDENITSLRTDAQLLHYGDGLVSLKNSSYDPRKPLKVLIHGFKGSGKEKGALSGVQEFLKLEDVNVIVVDWEKGADGSYSTAAANTELIGRQTAVMLMDVISYNSSVKDIHIIGFSLGAHIAGCAGEMLKLNGYKLGRITGLDPASPLFKHHLLREPSAKLDATKADFVDVIHTDGSPVFTDGFGLLRPIGHVDFFPNGGREQRGCSDGRASVVVSHIEGTINSSVVCSHVRAWQLFLESMKNLQDPNGCQFVGFHCPGGNDKFIEGKCFAQPKERCLPNDTECNIMGMGASPQGARGALYLATRDNSPFCGEQLQALVEISRKSEKTRGYLHMRLRHGDHFTNFKLSHEFSDMIEGGSSLSSIAVAEKNTISAPATPTIDALLSFQSLEFQTSQQNTPDVSKIIIIDNIYINDSRGNRWYYCNKDLSSFKNINGTTFFTLQVQLNLDPC